MKSSTLAAALLVTTLGMAAADTAEAALPVGLDLAIGGGIRAAPGFQQVNPNLQIQADLRIFMFTVGAEFQSLPGRTDPIGQFAKNQWMLYGNLGFNVPLPKARLAFRFGGGAGKLGGQINMAGAHESVALQFFPTPIFGFGFEADFDQTFRLTDTTWDLGIGILGQLVLRV